MHTKFKTQSQTFQGMKFENLSHRTKKIVSIIKPELNKIAFDNPELDFLIRDTFGKKSTLLSIKGKKGFFAPKVSNKLNINSFNGKNLIEELKKLLQQFKEKKLK